MNLARVYPIVEDRGYQFWKIFSQMKGAKATLQDQDRNLVYIDGSSLEFPHVDWGRDFEVRLLLDIENDSTIRKFVRSLPKRFERSLSFWGDYVNTLNQSFCKALGVRYSQIRFSQISDNQCTRFHSDNVLVRLFQTLQGPGTEYILEDNLNREGIGGGCNSKIVIDSSKVQRAREKDLLLIRGNKWFEGKGLVHRSPPIEHLGLKRFYLCIDAIKDLSDSRY